MGRRPRTFHPNTVLQSAIYSGLAALARLARGRVRSKTKKHYKSIDTNWMKAWKEWKETRAHDPYDYSSIQNAEPNLRGAFFRILWQTTKRYGNKETKRVYSWLEGTVGPLNALLNYAGARLRDLALTHYQFPDPQYYEVRVYADGTNRVFPESLAEKYPNLSAVKTYTKAGYPGNQHGPRILLSHPTLPGLDFVDMIRAHLIELCKQCFIYNVPRTEAHRYIRLLIHRLRPYLDWVYTQGKIGKKNFNPESDKELREVVNEIKAFHGRHAGRRKSVTKNIEGDQLPGTIEGVGKEIVRQLNQTKDRAERRLIQKILDHLDQGTLQDRDAEKLRDQVLSLSQREGNDWHRILLSDLHHPASLKQVVFAGDKMLEEPAPILIVGELPVDKRIGQIDITFFLRREIPGQIIMTPMLILEIKSKTAFNYNLYSFRTRNRKKKDYGPRLFAWKRSLTDDEWNTISKARPSDDTTDQLDVYERILLQEYKSLVPSDPTPPDRLWKGAIVLDTDQRPIDVFDAFQDLLADLATALVNDMIDSSSLTSYIPDPDGPLKLALLLTPSEGPAELIQQMSPPDSIIEENPYYDRISDDRILTLYVSVPSSTSSGNAAAWLSRNWHLLHHIHECEEKIPIKTEVFWLDLMGAYKEIVLEDKEAEDTEEAEKERIYLINRRFGLDKLLGERSITRKAHRQATELLKKIKFVDLSSEIDTILLKNRSEFSDIIDTVQSKTIADKDTEKIIVLDGWSEFRNMVSREHRSLVKSLERTLLDVLPEKDTNIIWIDSGVPHTRMNPRYQRKCVRPLPHDSHRWSHLDEIIYNTPTTPRLFGWQTPRREDVRVIIQDTPTSADPWSRTIDVPILRDFAKKVRGAARRDGLVSKEDLVRPTHLSPMYLSGVTLSTVVTTMWPLTEDTVTQIEHNSMTLIPSILRSRGKDPEEVELETDETAEELQVEEEVEEEADEEEVSRYIEVESITSPSKTISLTKRMVLHPTHPPPHHPRAREQYHEAKKITRGWCYDSFPEEEDEVAHPISRPPLIESSTSPEIDTTTSKELELRRLLYAAQHLMRILPSYEELYHCCESIVSSISLVLKKKKTEQVLLRTLRDVKHIIKKTSWREQVWETLLPVRRELVTLLNSENRKSLEKTSVQTPDVLELYGNNLFLTICAILEELVQEDQQLTMAVLLWSVVAQWVPYQLGLRAMESEVSTKYDLHAIYANLRIRTKLLLDKIPAIQSPVTQEHGQILWSEEEGIFEAWIIFQGEEEMVGGLVKGLREPLLRIKYYDCVKDVESLKNAARKASNCTARKPIITHKYEDNIILWQLFEDENEGVYWLPFVLKHPVDQSRKRVPLPWFILSEVPPTLLTKLQPPANVEVEVLPYTEKNIDRLLQSVTDTTQEPARVTCHVSIDVEQELYQLDFTHNLEALETQHYSETYRLLRTLRHPIRIGSGYETSSEDLLTWDHKSDVEYQDVTVERDGETETISLTLLKPFVHRSRFYPDEYSIPKTCSELLSTEEGESLTLVIQSEDSCFRSLSVKIDGAPADSSLRALETVSTNIYDIALLTECEHLIDSEKGTRHRVTIDAKGLFDLKFSRLSDYSRLKEALESLDVSDYDWSEGSWTVSISYLEKAKNQIRWQIESVSGEAWQNKVFDHQMDYTLSIDEVISNFKEEVSQIVPLKHLSGLSEVIAVLRSTLTDRGWRKGRLQCRLELEHRGGGYVCVVNRVELRGDTSEIDSFPIDVMSDEEVLSRIFQGEWGPVSEFDVVNLEKFYESVSLASTEEEEDSEVDEETQLIQVINDWREDEDHPLAQRFLGDALAKLAELRLSQDRKLGVLEMAEEAIGLLRTCDTGVRLSLARALVVKASVLLRKERDNDEVKIFIQEAKDLVRLLKPDISVKKMGEWIDRLFQEVGSK